MKYTFALIKPDVTDTPQEGDLLDDILQAGFIIEKKKYIKVPAAHIVATHLEKLRTEIPEAFDRNLQYLMTGPVVVLQLSHTDPETDPITRLRELAGLTDPSKASKFTLRHKYGNDSIENATKENRGLRNAIHCSDSEQTAYDEYQLWFEGKIPERQEEPLRIVIKQNHYGKFYFPTISKCPVCSGINGCGSTDPNKAGAHWKDKEIAFAFALVQHGYHLREWTTIDPKTGQHTCNVSNAHHEFFKCGCKCQHIFGPQQVKEHHLVTTCAKCGVTIGVPDSD